ncbi:RND transporter [Roseibium aquae]|uniref:RND transporter n=1 Tax=Roseibium aquae TaxID=1323746 RepID=A0A916X2F3_9HYPH|nr:efflux RND transporter periplasmic adaptor subunit [Roseibium aquae]GGB52692.1 RND transporter [Roseibium aquae]
MRRLALIAVLAGLAGAALLAWQRPVEVTIAHPYRGDAAEVVYATAVVEPVHWAKVTPVVRERLVSLCDCEGEWVEEGRELAVLDSGDARATLKELEARQELATSERERAFELLERRVISQHTYDRAQSQLVQINALLAAQRERLNDYRILAPMTGMVLRQDGAIGEVAAPGDILFWIGQPRPLRLVAEVNEEDIPKVSTDQRALVRADAFPDQELEAAVQRITPKGDPVLKNYRVYLSLPDETPLRIGMTVELNIITREVRDTLLIPAAALDKDTVLIVAEDGRAERRWLKTGIRGTRAVEVLEGLDEDTKLVTPYRSDIKDGQRVAATEGAGS